MTTAPLYFVAEVTMSLVRMCTMTISLVRVCMCMCLRARERERREKSERNAGGGSGLRELSVSNNSEGIAQPEKERIMNAHLCQRPEDTHLMHIGCVLPVKKEMELESAVGFFSPKRMPGDSRDGLQEKVTQRRLRMGLRWLLKTFVDQGRDASPCYEFGVSVQIENPQVPLRDPIAGTGFDNSLCRPSTLSIPSCTVAWSETSSCSVAHKMQRQAMVDKRPHVDLEGSEDDEQVRTPKHEEFETHPAFCEDGEWCSELRRDCECSPLPNQTLPSPELGCQAARQCRTFQEDSEAEDNLMAQSKESTFTTKSDVTTRLYFV